MNLDGGCAGGVDLDGGHAVEAHVEEERGTSWRWSAQCQGRCEGGAGVGMCVVGK
jgi:hypothetical protein